MIATISLLLKNSETIEDLQELRRLKRRHGGIDVEKLSKGDKKKKKKDAEKEKPSDPWKLLTGGLVDKDAVRKGGRYFLFFLYI